MEAENPGGGKKPRRWRKPAALLVLLAVAAAAVRIGGLSVYLEEERLRAVIAAAGWWAPVAYALLYAVASVLFLPGIPFTVVGGVLFGPLWGVVYAITGATAGACLAFLVSRYVARSWVEKRLDAAGWRRLDREVARQGWKVVAVTRLVPLFPFNLLNYALGLTSIRFVPYAVATFLGMLPACIALVVFSSSLLDLLRGRVSPTLLWGALLVGLTALLPLVLRRRRSRSGTN